MMAIALEFLALIVVVMLAWVALDLLWYLIGALWQRRLWSVALLTALLQVVSAAAWAAPRTREAERELDRELSRARDRISEGAQWEPGRMVVPFDLPGVRGELEFVSPSGDPSDESVDVHLLDLELSVPVPLPPELERMKGREWRGLSCLDFDALRRELGKSFTKAAAWAVGSGLGYYALWGGPPTLWVAATAAGGVIVYHYGSWFKTCVLGW